MMYTEDHTIPPIITRPDIILVPTIMDTTTLGPGITDTADIMAAVADMADMAGAVMADIMAAVTDTADMAGAVMADIMAAAADMADIADRPRLYLFQHQAWQFMMYIHIFLSSVPVVFFSGHP